MPSNSGITDNVALWSRVVMGDKGCLDWIGHLDAKGYGQISRRGKNFKAHRFAYEVLVGKIPSGLVLDHKCRNRRCVNPDHLEPVTQLENVRRGKSFAVTNANKTHCPRGHPYVDRNVVFNNKGSRLCLTCKRRVARDYIRKIRNRKETT